VDGNAGVDQVLPLQLALALHPETIRAAHEVATSLRVRASLRALFAAVLAQGDAADRAGAEAALVAVKEAADADLPAARGPSEPTGKYEDTVFEIDARLLVPPNGYGLTAVRRFLVAFGRRRHLGAVPFAILFVRAASDGSGRVPTS
jgi:hypothetical protein